MCQVSFKSMKNSQDMNRACLIFIPFFMRSTTWWKCATPKNKGHTYMAVFGVKHCRSNGNMQARKVHSSDNGATTWFLHQINVRTLPNQYIGSERKLITVIVEFFTLFSWDTNQCTTAIAHWILGDLRDPGTESSLGAVVSQSPVSNLTIVDPTTPKRLPVKCHV